MKRRLRRTVALLLLALGALGLLATGSGVWPGSPWPWLVVLALAVACQVAGDHFDQRQRLARRLERRLREMEGGVQLAHRSISDSAEALRAHIDKVGTPESMKVLVDNVNRMVLDLKPIREDWESVRTAGGLRALMARGRP